MTKRERRLQRIRQNPKNVSFDELCSVLEDYGFKLERVEGSHHTYSYVLGGETKILTVPYARPVKMVYVKQMLKIIEKRKRDEQE